MKTTILLSCLLLLSLSLNAQTNISDLESRATAGDVGAMWKLGEYYYKNYHAANSEEAGYWLQKAYKQDKNNADGIYTLGCWFYSYRECPKLPTPEDSSSVYLEGRDTNKGIECFKRSAELGNINAAIFMFKTVKKEVSYTFNSDSKHLKADREASKYAALALAATPDTNFNDYLTLAQAAHWIHNAQLQFKYALKAVDNDEYWAIDYLLRLNGFPYEDITNPKTMYKVAYSLWKRGNDKEKDGEIGLRLYTKSANAGYEPAQAQMGYIYLTGQIVSCDTLKAIAYYKESAKNGNTTSKNIIAHFYQNGIYLPQNQELAFSMFKESADFGNIVAKYQVGLCLYNGLGVEKNLSKALNAFLEVEKTVIPAPYMLGLIYYERNDSQALRYWEAYLKKGNADQAIKADIYKKMSSCYRFGRCGLSVDAAKAEEFFSKAKDLGDEDAIAVMERLSSISIMNK